MQGVQSRPSGFAAVTLTLTLFLTLAGTSGPRRKTRSRMRCSRAGVSSGPRARPGFFRPRP